MTTIHDLLMLRRSRRAIDPTRSVPVDVVDRLIEAARWAPSSMNEQPWRFSIADARVPAFLDQLRALLAPGNAWALQAPLLILVSASLRHARNGSPNDMALHDVGAATENLLLQAAAEGLVQHPMGGFDKAAARAHLPEGQEPTTILALGWPGDPMLLPEDKRAREDAPRVRRPTSEIATVGLIGG